MFQLFVGKVYIKYAINPFILTFRMTLQKAKQQICVKQLRQYPMYNVICSENISLVIEIEYLLLQIAGHHYVYINWGGFNMMNIC